MAQTHTDTYACMYVHVLEMHVYAYFCTKLLSRNMPAGGPELSALWQ